MRTIRITPLADEVHMPEVGEDVDTPTLNQEEPERNEPQR